LEESVRFGSSFAIKQLSRGSNLSRGQDFIGADNVRYFSHI
jgi:hypothetical protein